MKSTFSIILILALFSLLGCDVGDDKANNANNVNNTNNANNVNNTNNTNYTELKSDLARDEDPAVDPGDYEDIIAGINQFHFDCYGELAGLDDGNIIYSPWSITTALAMTWAGAANNTETEMASVMHFPASQSTLHGGLNQLDLYLESLGTGDPLAFTLSSTNSIWGQEGYSFEQAFLDVLALNYGAGLNLLDFATDPEAGRLIINDWVSQKTAGRIDELLAQGTLDSLTRMVLVNTLYFKAKWMSQFAPDATGPATFHTIGGSDVTVDFMTQDGSALPYYEGTGYKAVELPYVGDDTSMVVIMPDAGTFSTFEASLDAATLGTIVDSLEITPTLFLTMPKFNFSYGKSLKPILESLGMNDAFVMGTADFTNMHQPLELYISDVIHEAFIGIDEAGTEAGAATAVIMSGFGDVIDFTVDSPFLFFIRDNETGVILFAGRVTDPS
ncbi:serpin family protein [Myxococcota bacterium]|nr:serpin family protein [Myxococcota bacterium]